jgi:hypothetical protein
MAYRMYGALIASLSVVVLMLAANETFARSGAAHFGGLTSRHSIARHSLLRAHRHHRRNDDVGIFWPGVGDTGYAPSNGEPFVDGPPPIPGDIRNTQASDVPWDWAHRYPPAVAPSERPYVQSCSTETVTVPGGYDGKEQAVSVMRCY